MTKQPRAAPTTWRPTADSFRNLMLFWAALGVAAVPGVATVAGPAVLAALLATACAGGLVVAATMSRARVGRALQAAGHPSVANWPPRGPERDKARRAGWASARKTALVAVVVGGALGFVPLLGAGVAAAGWAGAIGAALVWRTVRRYEDKTDSFVVTARADRSERGRRPGLELGLLRRPAA